MERVECEGGPLDGAVIEIVDDTRHRYARQEVGESRFSWRGRS